MPGTPAGEVHEAQPAGRMVYTEGVDLPEYPILLEEMTRWLPAVHVSNADLLGGRLRRALDAALAAPFPDPPRMDGAEEAARAVLEGAGAGRQTTAS